MMEKIISAAVLVLALSIIAAIAFGERPTCVSDFLHTSLFLECPMIGDTK
jgi:hypothetical protein